MKNPIKKTNNSVKFGTLALTAMVLASNAQTLNSNPLVQEVFATENTVDNTANTVNYTKKDLESMKKLVDYLRYLCSFSTQKGGHVTYIKGSSTEGRNRQRLEEKYSDCSWFIFWGMEHVSLVKDKKDFVRSAAWGNNGYENSVEVAACNKGEPWEYSKASPRRCYLGRA